MSNDEGEELYQWSHLELTSIRVLRLIRLEPETCIELEMHPLDHPPEYTAISYAWGTQIPSKTLICEGKQIRVTESLYEGLRSINLVSEPDLLWVDAISINQRDDIEKAHQVRNMYDIFKKAASVIVWLGPEAMGSDFAITGMHDVKDKLPTMPEDLNEVLLQMKSHEYSKVFDLAYYEPLSALSKRTWFQRLWVAQEFIVGRSISMICGRQKIDSKDFIKVIRRLTALSFGNQQPKLTPEDGQPFEGFRMLSAISEMKKSLEENESLRFFELVMFGRVRDTVEPLDHIYAVLGLAEGRDEIYRAQIPVDYSEKNRMAYWNTYVEFGKIALLHEEHLKLLSVAASYDRPSSLPSWCPNLNSEPLTSAFSEVFASGWPASEAHSDFQPAKGSTLLHCEEAHPGFKTNTVPHIQLSRSSNVIGIFGGRLDRISVIGNFFEWGPDFNTDDLYTAKPFAEGLLKWLKECESICGEVSGDKEIAACIFEEVLVSATDPKHEKKWAEEGGKRDLSAYNFLLDVALEVSNLLPDAAGQVQNPELYRRFETLLAWIVTLQEDWYNRVLFVTENRRFGKASKDVKIGDEVCMFYSGRMMYVLRKADAATDPYSFVSEAYVYRLMNGEVFELMHTGEVKEEVFWIL